MVIFIREWQDPALWRAEDVSRFVPGLPVLVLPQYESVEAAVRTGPRCLGPLLETIQLLSRKGPVFIQIVSPEAGDGMGREVNWLAMAVFRGPKFR